MEHKAHAVHVIQYTIKESIVSIFDDLRHRRPLVQTDSPAAPQESFTDTHTTNRISRMLLQSVENGNLLVIMSDISDLGNDQL